MGARGSHAAAAQTTGGSARPTASAQPSLFPRHPVDSGPNCFDQVERQAVAVRSVGVQNAKSRIESANTSGQTTLAFGDGVRVIQETVRWVN
jgi:hypothetical protein